MSESKSSESQLDLEGVKRPRGRPKTGNAMSAAERQRAYRRRQKKLDRVELQRTVRRATVERLEFLEERGVSLDQVIDEALTVLVNRSELEV